MSIDQKLYNHLIDATDIIISGTPAGTQDVNVTNTTITETNSTDILTNIQALLIELQAKADLNEVQPVTLARNDLGYDAWGRPKVILDYTLFSALWTFSVPNRMWLQWTDSGAGYIEQTEIDNNFIGSYNGSLQIVGVNTQDTFLISKRHPRYQPNKGLLYSTAIILPDPIFTGSRGFGLYSIYNGLFFELVGNDVSWHLDIVRRTTKGGITTDFRTDITSFLPTGFDISKGHVYDIQAEWRGLGDIFIYVDLKLVFTMQLLGTLDALSVSNPALHVAYGISNVGASPILMYAGCVDVTSEGGHKSNKIYTSQSTGTTLLPTNNTGRAMIAIKIPNDILYNGIPTAYTRDMVLTEFTSFCKDEAFRSVMFGRLINTTNLDNVAGWNVASDSKYEWIINDTGALDAAYQLDKANMVNVYTTRTEKDYSISHTNPDADHADFYFTAGDIIVVEIKSDGVSTGGATLEFAEEL